ncbi:MAG: hypothetical protein ACK5HJ_05530 [Bacteroidota bacterium]
MAMHYDRPEIAPMYKKANEIISIVDAIVESLDVDSFTPDPDSKHTPESLMHTNEYLKFLKVELMSNANSISVKLQTADAFKLYTQKMDNATVVKVSARALLTQTSALRMHNYKHHEYLLLLRTAIEEFRVLFVEWLATFDKLRDIPDGWGMFYDPEHTYELPEWEDGDDEDDDDFWKGIDDNEDDE